MLLQVGEQIASLQQKIKAKEAEKSRLYSHSNDEEIKLNETLNLFLSDSKHLRDLHKKIEEFDCSNKVDTLEQIAADVTRVAEEVKEKQDQYASTKAKLDSATKIVDDQERQRKLLNDNIDLHTSEGELADLEEQIQELEKEEASVAGASTAQALLDKAQERMAHSKNEASNLAGSHRAIRDQVKGLERKLASPEYKNVDREHQEATIKLDTTVVSALCMKSFDCSLMQQNNQIHFYCCLLKI